MLDKVCLCLFILNVVLSQGIVGTFLEDDTEESSHVLVREKRVINREPGGDVPVPTGEVSYVVNIKKFGRLHCIGTILSHLTVITAARCAAIELSGYSVISGSTYTYNGTQHNITEKKLHGHSPSRAATFMSGIALLTVSPPFVFDFNTKNLELHAGPLLVGVLGTVSGWGAYCYGGRRETAHARRLRSIEVPIMSHRDCVNIYKDVFVIRDEDICTYHPRKLCGYTDAGAPLVINNELVGVHIGVIETGGREYAIKPDVFALLQHFEYRVWIRANIV